MEGEDLNLYSTVHLVMLDNRTTLIGYKCFSLCLSLSPSPFLPLLLRPLRWLTNMALDVIHCLIWPIISQIPKDLTLRIDQCLLSPASR